MQESADRISRSMGSEGPTTGDLSLSILLFRQVARPLTRHPLPSGKTQVAWVR